MKWEIKRDVENADEQEGSIEKLINAFRATEKGQTQEVEDDINELKKLPSNTEIQLMIKIKGTPLEQLPLFFMMGINLTTPVPNTKKSLKRKRPV